jgi:hypothetical protein
MARGLKCNMSFKGANSPGKLSNIRDSWVPSNHSDHTGMRQGWSNDAHVRDLTKIHAENMYHMLKTRDTFKEPSLLHQQVTEIFDSHGDPRSQVKIEPDPHPLHAPFS